MDWRKHISELSPDIEFNSPAKPTKIAEAEKKLGIIFPGTLKELWSQSNGLIDDNGVSFVWPCEEIFEQNMTMRTESGFRKLYMPFDTLLFFGDNGGGDMYFFRILEGKIRDEFTFRWDHESDSRIAETFHLKSFIENYITNSHDE